jgi:hypothetical protein
MSKYRGINYGENNCFNVKPPNDSAAGGATARRTDESTAQKGSTEIMIIITLQY